MQTEPLSDYGTSVFDVLTRQLLLRFDCNITEKFSLDADITAFPVESGISITDNHQAKQRMFELVGEVSNTPLDGDTTEQRARRAFDVLDDLCASGRKVAITASLRNFESCLIKSYVKTRDVKTAQTLRVTVSFVEIVQVTSASVEVPIEILSALKRASGKSKTNKTGKDKKPTPKQETGRKTSLAKRAANFLVDNEIL